MGIESIYNMALGMKFPTKKQMDLIKKIEEELGVRFEGVSRKDASDFIDKYIDDYMFSVNFFAWDDFE